MTTAAFINGVVDEVISRLKTNIVSLGDPDSKKYVYERDEYPPFIENFPSFFVLPLAERQDTIKFAQGGDQLWHEFPIIIAGYYKKDGLETTLRETRDYAYTCLELFKGQKINVSDAYVTRATVKVGYWIAVDYTIHTFIITLNLKAVEG